ncbi:MoaD [Candidatus Methylomirabilis lanthanidiphila]|uniref:MoaD n=1 Tax=Candidatus Methylomirabilis lanthanidiphila TaxID=2211376 RepID=A0A564ZNQ6_9BACT|nr:MoaD/ThiS family protein [Candidatus Methylomirabilis lanthanidiphila]VUZ86188.1 MoaD [Candidatus Methylomirabilis lanthanidiphila]
MPEVRFLGAVRQAAGKSSFGIDAGTVEQILEALNRVTSPACREFLFEGDRLRQDVEVLVNDRNITSLDGVKTALAPFDQVTLFIKGTRGLSAG